MTILSEAKRRFAAAQAELRDAERRTRQRFGSEPDVGTVLTFQKRFDGAQPYWYAAIRTPVGWYLTGRQVESMDWRALCDFIGDGQCAVATEWEKLPDVGEPTHATIHTVDKAAALLYALLVANGSRHVGQHGARTAITEGKGVPSWYRRPFDETDHPEWTSG